jgi:hypothetical protein
LLPQPQYQGDAPDVSNASICPVSIAHELYQDEGIAFRSTMSNASMCTIEPIVISIDWRTVLWHRKVIILIVLRVKI